MLLKLLFALLVAVNGKTILVPQQWSDGRLEVMQVESNPCVEKCVVDQFGQDINLLNQGIQYKVCAAMCDNPDGFTERNEL